MRRVWILFLVLFLCWGCKRGSEPQTVVLKDVWLMEQANISSFDPIDAYHANHIQLVKQLFNTLTDIDATGKIVPSLAKAWHSDDGCHWTFELRDDVLFQNDSCFDNTEDRLFSAQDVKFTFERLLSKDSKSLGVSYFLHILGVPEYRNGICDTIRGIEVINDHTIAFVLDGINYSFPNLLSLPFCSIVKERAVHAYNPKLKPIGTGPFQLDKYLPDERISLIKNQEYWERVKDERIPYIDGVDITLATDENFSFLLFKNKKTDFIDLSTAMRRQNETTRYSFKTRMTTLESAQLNFYLFNLTRVKNPNIRKGISHAIDRIKMQELIGKDGTATTSLYPKMFGELHGDKDLLKTDPQKARTLFAGQRMRLKLVAMDDLLSRSVAMRVKEDLAPYSIYVDVETVPFPVLVDRLSSGEYDMIQLYWGMLYADVDHFLTPFKVASFPPEGNNFNRYSNAEFEELLKDAQSKEGERQVERYKDAENVILEDMPFVLLYYKNVNMLSNTRFNLPVNPLLYKYYKYAKQ